MNIERHALDGVLTIKLAPRSDERGYFMRVFDEEVFAAAGVRRPWVQENQARSVQPNTLRGLHFQRPPHAETKLVRCVRGAMLDVFVDLRAGSPTYGSWGSVELTEDNATMVLVPHGFAHGYLTLVANTVASYRVDAVYAPAAEGGLRWDDPTVGIVWPTLTPILSDKDKVLPSLQDVAPIEGVVR